MPELSEVYASPFVSSWMGRARSGSLTDPDPSHRSAAWAHWALSSLSEVEGRGRSYPALLLPGRFYDPKGTAPTSPHLEVPTKRLSSPDDEFPDRLSLAGNALTFEWWVVSEALAARRSLFNTLPGRIDPLARTLTAHRSSLVRSVGELSSSVEERWALVEAAIASGELSETVAGNFSEADVLSYFPAAKGLGLRVVFDSKHKETNGKWVSRRMGVWQLVGASEERFSLGVLTPRLTVNSLFHDPLFTPAGEGLAALLVRGLLLSRLSTSLLALSPMVVGGPDTSVLRRGTYLKALVPQGHSRMPAASPRAATLFVQAYPDAAEAWAVLQTWAGSARLAVTREGFLAAHASVLRYVRRAEEPLREDVDLLLPLAFEAQGRVVRATFVGGGE